MVRASVFLASGAAALALAVFDGRDAEACSCGPPPLYPRDAATGVPTNLDRILVDPELGAREVWREATGEPVPLGIGNERDGWLQYELMVELAPNETYIIGRGELVFSRFTTGAGPDLTAAAATLQTVSIARATLVGEVSSCGNDLTAVESDLVLPDDAVLIQLRITGPSLDYSAELPAEFGLSGAHGRCWGDSVQYAAGAEYCFEVRPRDAAGNVGAAATSCTVVRACGDVSDSEAFYDDPMACGGAESGGCRTTSAPGGLLLIALAALAVFVRRKTIVSN